MAAQSAAESVKVVPFPSRKKCAVLYSTSPILAAWSFGVPAELPKNPVAKANGSLPYRRSCGPSREYAVNEFPILHDGNSVHKYELDPIRRLQRLLKRGLIKDAIRIEHREVRICSHTNTAFALEDGRALLQTLRRHQRHFPQRGHQVERLFLAHVVSQHARKSSLSTRMNLRSRDGHAVAGNHDHWIRYCGTRCFLRYGMDNDDPAFLAVLLKCFRSQTLARVRPLQVVKTDFQFFLPARIENSGLKVGAARRVGIAFGGHIKPAFLRTFNHGDQLRRVFQAHASDVYHMQRSAGRGRGCDDFFQGAQTRLRLFPAGITKMYVHRAPIICRHTERFHNFPVRSTRRVVNAHAFGKRPATESLLDRFLHLNKFFRSRLAMRRRILGSHVRWIQLSAWSAIRTYLC